MRNRIAERFEEIANRTSASGLGGDERNRGKDDEKIF
jgi:hypothetical protein